jgi:hypothetical protein
MAQDRDWGREIVNAVMKFRGFIKCEEYILNNSFYKNAEFQ